ncbi:hypothetical protein MMC13_003647 [Lambiella insularis]|nr:hypothetical protein [Lambiella insularis]
MLSPLLPLFFLLSLATALPSPLASPTPSPSLVPTGRTYYLKTVSNTSSFNDLFLTTYHTGAGLNDAVFVPAISKTGFNASNYPAATGFLNGTQQEFDLGNDFPYGMAPVGDTTYDAWLPVQINVGFGYEGFYFNNTDGTGVEGLKWVDGWPYELAGTKDNEFGGWLALRCGDEATYCSPVFRLAKEHLFSPQTYPEHIHMQLVPRPPTALLARQLRALVGRPAAVQLREDRAREAIPVLIVDGTTNQRTAS